MHQPDCLGLNLCPSFTSQVTLGKLTFLCPIPFSSFLTYKMGIMTVVTDRVAVMMNELMQVECPVQNLGHAHAQLMFNGGRGNSRGI